MSTATNTRLSSRRPGNLPTWLGLAAATLLVPACEGGGHFRILGYSTKPNYDEGIRTVYVPVFNNLTLRRGLEFDLTRAVVRQIETKTPYKVVSNREAADTELLGTIISLNKAIINRNQLNEVREAETTLAVEVVWRDIRTGELLSRPRPQNGIVAIPPGGLGIPGLPDLGVTSTPSPPGVGGTAVPPTPLSAPAPAPPAGPVLVQSLANFIPELGESLTTAEQKNVNRLAVQIVSMMEKPW
ncbi:MAG: LPS assembly lipoprotein LptE [Gemmataceae bacterium]|nr:LPS assembly lipoprotein LptE [Gemmataceae bacterium]MDW8267260.1 LptE family protein [Gemmataceae bacterium]